MRIIFCGSRTYKEPPHAFDLTGTLIEGLTYNYHKFGEPIHVFHGACPTGTDQLIDDAVEASDLPAATRFRADWETHGNAAGPIRNGLMLAVTEPHVVIAIVDKPLAESRGTNDMVQRAIGAKVPTYVIEKVA